MRIKSIAREKEKYYVEVKTQTQRARVIVTTL